MTIWQNKGRYLLAVLLAVAMTGAVACSGDDDDGDDASPTQPAAAATEATSDPSPEATEETAATDGSEALTLTIADGDLGPYLADADGKSLYVFTRDAENTSNCTGDCLSTWPPLLVEEGQAIEADGADGEFGSIEIEEGMIVTYNGAPLYYFAADAAAGDTNGHLVGDVWFLARPETASTAYIGVRDTYLVGPTGMSLYFFANDTEGVSNCSGDCLTNWPAVTVPEGLDPTAVAKASGELDVVTRDDGVRQITYNGLPLYYFAGDSVPGDTNGDGVGGVWTLATP
jgi:predicted lipoprotein with Yx(FWY)xxD motif